MKNVSFVAPVSNPSGPRVLYPRNTISTVQSVMKRNLQQNASNATRSSPKEELHTEMNHGIENALLVLIVRNLWLVKGSPHVMTNHIVRIVLVNSSAKDAQLAANPSQVLVEPDSFLSRAVIGTMIASSAAAARAAWWARVS